MVIAGHTAQLIRGLVESLASVHFHYIFPIAAGTHDVTLWDPEDKCPSNLQTYPIGVLRHEKIGLSLDSIELCATVRSISQRTTVRSAVFVYPFPALISCWRLFRDLRIPTVSLLRGGDAYKWLDPNYVSKRMGAIADAVHVEYVSALRECIGVFAASGWLRRITEQWGVPCAGVIPSPPPHRNGCPTAPILDRGSQKRALIEALGSRWVQTSPDPKRNWLLWSGRIHPDKGLPLALEAYAAVRPSGWQMIIAGDGDRRLLPTGTDPDFAHVVVPPRLLGYLYASADAFIHTAQPSADFIDARPSSVTSATAFGLPSIAVYDPNMGGAQESISIENLVELGVNAGLHTPLPEVLWALSSRIERLSDRRLLMKLSESCSTVTIEKPDSTLAHLLGLPSTRESEQLQ